MHAHEVQATVSTAGAEAFAAEKTRAGLADTAPGYCASVTISNLTHHTSTPVHH